MSNGDVSKWDVSRVHNMDYIFQNVKSFKQELCGAAWVHSNASKIQMFAGSPGSISRTVCTCTTSSAFSPGSEEQLKSAVDECLKLSPKGDCSTGPYGAIGEWDVSRVTDMDSLFFKANLFNDDITKRDVSSISDKFFEASTFNGDISKWDVSSVTGMSGMFQSAASFSDNLSKWDVSSVTGMSFMFSSATVLKRCVWLAE